MKLSLLFRVCGLGCVLTFGVSGLRADIQLADGFRVGRDGRAAGASLSGTKTETGDAIWSPAVGSVPIVFTEAGGGAVRLDPRGADKSAFAFVPIPDAVQLQLEAKVNPGAAPDTNWVGLGFSATATQGLWAAGTLWVSLRPWGDYEVYIAGISVCLTKGSAPRFVPNGDNHLKIAYDSAAKTANVWINGVKVLSDAEVGDYTPRNNFAGIGFLKTASACVDDFKFVGK